MIYRGLLLSVAVLAILGVASVTTSAAPSKHHHKHHGKHHSAKHGGSHHQAPASKSANTPTTP